MKISPVGAKLFHVDKRKDTDITKLIVAFQNFANEPKNNSPYISYVIYEQEAVLQENIDSNFSVDTWKLLRSLPVKIWLHLRDICSRPKITMCSEQKNADSYEEQHCAMSCRMSTIGHAVGDLHSASLIISRKF
jgi:hypothetical protein